MIRFELMIHLRILCSLINYYYNENFRGYEDFALGHENTKFSELIKNFKNRFRKRPGPSDPRALRDVFMLMAVNQTAENQAKLMRHL